MQTGRKILNLRCDRKISQQDLAKASEITPSALSKIEAGINSPRANVLWRIAQNLGVTVEYLLDEGIPYPYACYSYRQDLRANNVDPETRVPMEVTLEEKSFLEALRHVNHVARDIAMSIPEASMETIRLVHFILNHSRVENPSRAFLETFESLVTTGQVEERSRDRETDRPTPRSHAAPAARARPKQRQAPANQRRRAPTRRKSRQKVRRS